MNIKQLFTVGLLALSVSGFACSASAGVMEDIHAINPKIKTHTQNVQHPSGLYYQTTSMTIYYTTADRADITMTLIDVGGTKGVYLDYDYFGREWRFADYFSVGNGLEVRLLFPQSGPRRKLYSGPYCEEQVSVKLQKEDLLFLKNTQALRVISRSRGYYPVNFLKTKKASLSLSQAAEYAIKFLSE